MPLTEASLMNLPDDAIATIMSLPDIDKCQDVIEAYYQRYDNQQIAFARQGYEQDLYFNQTACIMNYQKIQQALFPLFNLTLTCKKFNSDAFKNKVLSLAIQIQELQKVFKPGMPFFLLPKGICKEFAQLINEQNKKTIIPTRYKYSDNLRMNEIESYLKNLAFLSLLKKTPRLFNNPDIQRWFVHVKEILDVIIKKKPMILSLPSFELRKEIQNEKITYREQTMGYFFKENFLCFIPENQLLGDFLAIKTALDDFHPTSEIIPMPWTEREQIILEVITTLYLNIGNKNIISRYDYQERRERAWKKLKTRWNELYKALKANWFFLIKLIFYSILIAGLAQRYYKKIS